MLTAVVDLPTPPLPDATAMIAAMPGTPRLPEVCDGGACGAGRRRGRAAAGGAGRGAAGRGGTGASMPPPFFSAVSATMAPATPGIDLTTRSAAARSGSISWARAAGTVIEKNTLPSAMKISETMPSETMSPVKSGPLTVLRRSRTASLVMLMLFLSTCLRPSDSASGPPNQAASPEPQRCGRLRPVRRCGSCQANRSAP